MVRASHRHEFFFMRFAIQKSGQVSMLLLRYYSQRSIYMYKRDGKA